MGSLDEHSLHLRNGPVQRTECTTTYGATVVPTNHEIASGAIKLLTIDSVYIRRFVALEQRLIKTGDYFLHFLARGWEVLDGRHVLSSALRILPNVV
jgi:hypothetical protein